MAEVAGDDDGEAATFVTFAGDACVGGGVLDQAAVAARRALDRDEGAAVLVFEAATGRVRDLDLRGTEADVRARYASGPVQASKRGRPKLGVVAREVTLLPRHWEWLAAQPGGASIALRKLVEAARKQDRSTDLRARREAAYQFMSAMAGDRPGFEEAGRALFAGDRARLVQCSRDWPADIRDQLFACLGEGAA
jgi:hypothetical protein